MKTAKRFKSAPLPFQGQKRRFIGAFSIAMEKIKEENEVRIIVDLFGGSGLLSHTAKHIFPHAQVIYNDYDHYTIRLNNIGKTNLLLSDIRNLLKGIPAAQRIIGAVRNSIINRVESEDQTGYVDYITLSSSLMFSSKYVINFEDLSKEGFYNNVKMSDYDFSPEEYLRGLEVVHMDYKELFEQYKKIPGVLFLVDPPYLSTDTSTYSSDKYWKLRDYLDVLTVLNGTNYFFFTSNKSSLLELCEWISEHPGFVNPFQNSVLNTQNVTLNKSSKYTDMMLYKLTK